MIVTQANARRIIAAAYGPEFKFKLTLATHVGVRPVYETQIGLRTLAWRKLDKGQDSAVRIGQLLPNCDIDWAISEPLLGKVSA